VGLSLSCHLNGGRGERCFSSVLINFLILASVSENAEPTPEEQDKSLDKPKQKKNRCFMCRKKVGLTGKKHSFCLFFKGNLGFGPLKTSSLGA